MKAWKFIQKAAILIGMVTALSIADGTEATGKELWAAFVITALVVVLAISDCVRDELKRMEE